MLKAPADFPFTGSFAFLRPGGERVRILQHVDDAHCLVGIVPEHHWMRDASDNRRVLITQLAATRAEAFRPAPRRRRARARKGGSR